MPAFLRACILAVPLAIALPFPLSVAQAMEQQPPTPVLAPQEVMASYLPRFGRVMPVVAIIGENSGTELTDYVIPYSLLAQSGRVDVRALSTAPGPVTMRPTSMQLVPQSTMDQFDADQPQGADYVIVPAVVRNDEPRLLDWIKAQRDKGATLVSICDGALVLANAGVLEGRRATAHWFTAKMRSQRYPGTEWISNKRYVVDARIVSSAGISAAIPASLQLIEAIAGHAVASELGARYGVREWSSKHDSEAFVPRFGVNLVPYAAKNYLNSWFFRNEAIGVPLEGGMDDIVLALTMDAYSRTGRSKAYALAPGSLPVRTLSGLAFIPDMAVSDEKAPAHLLTLSQEPGAPVFDTVLAGIAALYGSRTATGVAYDFEYAWQPAVR